MENLILENPLMTVISIISIILFFILFKKLVDDINKSKISDENENLSDEEIERRANWNKLASGTYEFKEPKKKVEPKLNSKNVDTFKSTTRTKLRLAKTEQEKLEIQAQIDFLKSLED